MDINDIKPTGDYGRFTDPSADSGAQPTQSPAFTDAKGKLEGVSSGDMPGPALDAVAGVDRATLQDPAKLEQTMRAAISELVDSGPISGSLSNEQKQSLADFLSADPMFRQQLEGYLRKVAA